jgi:hypothetical protein
MKAVLKSLGFVLCVLSLFAGAPAQEKRNERRPAEPAPSPRVEKDVQAQAPLNITVRYTYEFNQPEFVVSHIVVQHDSTGRGEITFIQRTETPIVEPIQLSTSAMGRILGLWRDLHFLDSNENYQASKNFAHLGTYKISMDDGTNRRTAEYNWSDNKTAWALTAEYRHVADQAILIFNIKLARDMQPLNAPGLMNELDSMLTRNELSDPQQLVPLLTELKSDEHIPLIARNHADRILKKIEK